METMGFCLSIEELAFAIGVCGGASVASDMLNTVLGARDKIEIEGRLLAASHSLIARNLLALNPATSLKQLDSSFAEIIKIILNSEISVRASIFAQGIEQIVNYFFFNSLIVESKPFNEVAVNLRVAPDIATVAQWNAQFFGLLDNVPVKAYERQLGVLPVSVIDEVRALVISDKDKAISLLQDYGIHSESARELATDLLETEYRGSVMRIDSQNGQMVSNTGFLVLKGKGRAWLFKITPQEPPRINLYYASQENHRRLFKELL